MVIIMKKYDLVVVGGGFSGVAAAVAASRDGLSVVLVEKAGSLGGAMSNCLVYPFMNFWTNDPDTKERKYLSCGIFTEMRKRQMLLNPEAKEFTFNPEYFKMALDELCEDAGVDILFHAALYDVTTDSKKITSIKVIAGSKNIEIEADFFIDATGDGNLFYLAGCDFALGRASDGLCQPMTTCFRMCGVDTDSLKKENPKLQELYKNYKENGNIKNPREDVLMFYGIGPGIVHFNTTRIVKLDPTNPFDVSKAEIEARRQIIEMIAFLKENINAFKNSDLISVASDIGVRESRKLKGLHILTEQELKNCTKFEDSIALGNYDIDIHNPAGSGTSHYYFKDGEYYTIPYRSLLPKEFDNMLVAGRCISATHEAQASIRIMPICACLGEAAGTAAAAAKNTGTTAHSVDIKEVQKRLKEKGAKL
jgi:hypothetical protein